MAQILRMPEVAANTTEAVVSSWNVALDTPYQAGDAIVTIETDKAVVDVEADTAGVLVEIVAQAGARVEVGAPIAWWSEDGRSGDAPDVPTDAVPPSVPTAQQLEPEPDPTMPPRPPRPVSVAEANAPRSSDDAGTRLFASPLARKLARENDVDLRQLQGSGPKGRIRRADVDAAIAARSAAPSATTQAPAPTAAGATAPATSQAGSVFSDAPVSRMRSAIARRLSESKREAPHFYLRGSARIDKLLELRARVNNLPDARPTSVTDWLVKAIGTAHTLEPSLNVAWRGEVIRQFADADVALAVATDTGLMTPVVRAVQTKSLGQVSAEASDLVERARQRRLRQAELEGGSITLTNLGMYGVDDFAAIINPPQAAILAVGAAQREVVPAEDGIEVATTLRYTLAVDHRPVDGAQAAQWLQHFRQLLEEPVALLTPFQASR